jgi:hypothetical protein
MDHPRDARAHGLRRLRGRDGDDRDIVCDPPVEGASSGKVNSRWLVVATGASHPATPTSGPISVWSCTMSTPWDASQS